MQADLLIHSAAQVITVASPGGPQRGAAMRELGIVAGGAVAVREGRNRGRRPVGRAAQPGVRGAEPFR